MGELPSVCVIGAGVSGLTACKALADFGVPHTCFEASDEVGGNWYFQNPNGVSSAYRSLHIDISKPSISFRDFPMPDRYPDYPHHTHIFEWLRDYADAFGLRERIRFNTRVQRAERGAERRLADHARRRRRENFDALLVCNGHHWDPRYPDFPGTFDGPQIHSHDYIDPSNPLDLYGKRVLVVGIGNSAVDIVSELARKTVSDTVFLSTRSGAYVVPKYIFGKPADQVVKTNPRIPSACSGGSAACCHGSSPGAWRTSGCRRPTTTSSTPTRPSPASCSDAWAPATRWPRATSPSCSATACASPTARVEQVDAIVYATGYNVSFPFFDPDFLSAPDNVLPLYKRMLKPGLDDLAFIGLGQPIPTIFPFSELQSKLAARWLSGDWAPPPAGRDGSGDPSRRGVPHRPLHEQAPPHDAARVVRLRSTSCNTRSIPAGQARARAGAPTGRATAGRAAALERRGARRRERGRPSTAAACAAPACTCAGEGDALRRRGRAPALRRARPRLRRHRRLGAPALRRALRRRRDRRARVRLPALRRKRRRAPAAAVDTPPARGLCRGDRVRALAAGRRSRARSSCGAPPTPAGTWSRWPSPTDVSPPSISQVPGMDGLVTLLNLARYAGPRPGRKARARRDARPRRLAARPAAGDDPRRRSAGERRRDDHPRRRAGLPRDRRPLVAQRGGRRGSF